MFGAIADSYKNNSIVLVGDFNFLNIESSPVAGFFNLRSDGCLEHAVSGDSAKRYDNSI